MLATEAGLPYATIAVVDNLANGLGATPLTDREVRNAVSLRTGRVCLPTSTRSSPLWSRRHEPLGRRRRARRHGGERSGRRWDHYEDGPRRAQRSADEILDGSGRALTAGLVNGHGHTAMTLLTATATTCPSWSGWRPGSGRPRVGSPTRTSTRGTRLTCLDDPERDHPLLGHVLVPVRGEIVLRAVVDSGIHDRGEPVYLAFDGAPDEARPEAVAALVSMLLGSTTCLAD